MKVKIKDTKIGAFLKSKAPEVLEVIGDLMPDNGILGVVKNAIDKISPSKLAGLSGELDEMEAEYLKDVQNARSMYQSGSHGMADSIAKKIINWNLVIIMGLVLIQVFVIMKVDGQIAAVITGVVGTVIGALISERNTVVNFFFGSSQGSKDKDNK